MRYTNESLDVRAEVPTHSDWSEYSRNSYQYVLEHETSRERPRSVRNEELCSKCDQYQCNQLSLQCRRHISYMRARVPPASLDQR